MNLLSLDLQQWRIGGGGGGVQGTRPPSRCIFFFYFHAVFGQNFAKYKVRAPGNPGSATVWEPVRDKILEEANLVDLGSLVSLGLVWNTLLNSNELNC